MEIVKNCSASSIRNIRNHPAMNHTIWLVYRAL